MPLQWALLLFRGINPNNNALGPCCCMECLHFLLVINPDSARWMVFPPSWADDAQWRSTRAMLLQRAPPPWHKGVLPLCCALATCSTVPALQLQRGPPPDTKEGALPSAVPWGCHCKERLTFFQGEGSQKHTMDLHFLFFTTTCSFYWITFLPHTNSVAQEPFHAPWCSSPPPIVSFPKVSMGELAMFLSYVVVMGNISYLNILSISFTNLHSFWNLFHGIDRIRLSPSQDTLFW